MEERAVDRRGPDEYPLQGIEKSDIVCDEERLTEVT
jgi:hypothetical protein